MEGGPDRRLQLGLSLTIAPSQTWGVCGGVAVVGRVAPPTVTGSFSTPSAYEGNERSWRGSVTPGPEFHGRREMTRRTGAAGLVMTVVLAMVTVGLTSLPSLSDDAHTAARPHRGTLKVTVVTPAGVPATAQFKKRRLQVAAAKGATGTRKTMALKVAAGTWRAVTRPVLYRDRYYVPVVRPAKPVVRAGRTTRATVTWKAAEVAHGLAVSTLQPTQIDFEFANPAPSSAVAVRYVAGSTAPQRVSAGHAATATATTAAVAGLTPGTVYSFGLFTKVGSRWLGPMPLTVTTPHEPLSPGEVAGDTAQYVTNPGTVLVDKDARLNSQPLPDGRVVTRLPRGVVPVVGTPVVLPPSAALPGGFVGQIAEVSKAGNAVVLRQAPLGTAFDYLKVSIPDLAATGTAVPIRRTAGTLGARAGRVTDTPARGRAAGSAGSESSDPPCTLTTGHSVSINPDLGFDGTFSMELAMQEHFGSTLR